MHRVSSHKSFGCKIFLTFLIVFSAIILFPGNKIFAQTKIWEDSFNGGVTTGGYSPDYQNGGKGTFEIKIEKGSTIRKAFLMAGRFGDAKPLTVTMNDKIYVFDNNNVATPVFQSTVYGGPSAVHVLDVTSNIDPKDSVYTLDVPNQGGPTNRFNDFYLFVAYNNKSLKKVNAAIFLRTWNVSAQDKFVLNLLVPTRKSADISVSLYCGYICHMQGDGEFVFMNGENLGQIGGHDSNSGYCGGPIGSFYYKDNKMYALEDDNVDKRVNGSDALINAKSLLKDKCKTFNLDFEVDKSVYGEHETNTIWGVIVAYGADECKPPNAAVTGDQQICKGSSVKLTASGGSRYLWSNGERMATIEVKPEITTQYFVTITEAGCSAKDSVTVNVFNTTDVSNAKDTTITSGTTATLNAAGGSTFKWSTGEVTQSIIVEPQRTTTYTVTISSGDCNATERIRVNVARKIKAYAGKDTAICIGSEIELKAMGGENYLWSNGATTQSIKVAPAVSTTYTVTVSTDMNSATDEVHVSVIDLSKAHAGNDTTICAGSAVYLKAYGGYHYRWSDGESLQTIEVRPKNTTTYTVTITSVNCFITERCKRHWHVVLSIMAYYRCIQ